MHDQTSMEYLHNKLYLMAIELHINDNVKESLLVRFDEAHDALFFGHVDESFMILKSIAKDMQEYIN